ncbi:MAG: 4Fe-4S binding protein [Candidatus Saganbacteria bacterium]|nr:4Fe-4S binding protein [Candidatus Saganbacteria bacterium]
MREQEYLKNVVTLKLDQKKCTGCRRCVEVCPHNVFDIKNKKAKIVDKNACMECGACEKNCPAKAIEVKAGVGCAAAMVTGFLRGTAPTCDCSGDSGSCCS